MSVQTFNESNFFTMLQHTTPTHLGELSLVLHHVFVGGEQHVEATLSDLVDQAATHEGGTLDAHTHTHTHTTPHHSQYITHTAAMAWRGEGGRGRGDMVTL